MPKFAVLGSYSKESWARMIDNPQDRTESIRKLIESAGGKLESFYLTLGTDDYMIIIDAPDTVSAAAISVAVASTGAVQSTRTIQLLEWSSAPALLAKAKAARGLYQPPGT